MKTGLVSYLLLKLKVINTVSKYKVDKQLKYYRLYSLRLHLELYNQTCFSEALLLYCVSPNIKRASANITTRGRVGVGFPKKNFMEIKFIEQSAHLFRGQTPAVSSTFRVLQPSAQSVLGSFYHPQRNPEPFSSQSLPVLINH